MTGPRLQSLAIAEPGVLKLGADRQLVVQPQLLAEVQKGVEDRLGPKASEYLYTAGQAWAAGELQRLRGLADSDQADTLARLFCQQATALGWGDWRIEALQPDEQGVLIQVARSPFAEAYGQSDLPVCHLIAGAVAALAEALYRVTAACDELHCLAQGAGGCQFAATGSDPAEGEAWSW
jgi:hypothetical protein